MPKTKKIEAYEIPSKKNVPSDNLLDYFTLVFGEKGVGKSSLFSEVPNNLTLMTEPGRRNLPIRMVEVAPRSIVDLWQRDEASEEERGTGETPWLRVQALISNLISGDYEGEKVKHLTIDTIDRFYQLALTHHAYRNNVLDLGQLNDYGSSWRQLKDDFEDTVNSIKFSGLGISVISHAQIRESSEFSFMDSGSPDSTVTTLAPTCSPACWRYLRAACDFSFYYGKRGHNRVLHVRTPGEIYGSNGVDTHFLDPDEKPVHAIMLGDRTPAQAYATLQASWGNKVYDWDKHPTNGDGEKVQPIWERQPIKNSKKGVTKKRKKKSSTKAKNGM